MSTALVEMVTKLEQLSVSITRFSKSDYFMNLLSENSDSILKRFNLTNKVIIFYLDDNSNVTVLLEEDGKKTIFRGEDIEGIPKKCLSEPNKMRIFLEQCYLKTSVYLDDLGKQGIKITAHLKLKGGGNTVDPERLWPNGVVPVYINENSFPKNSIGYKNIIEAINVWKTADVGLEFIRCAETENSDCIAFDKDASACFSNGVGRRGGRQNIACSLDGKSFDTWSIVHEIGHAVGLYHEQSRADRDQFVTVSSTADNNYKIQGKAHDLYDFDSIMHYPTNENLQIKTNAMSSPLVRQATSVVGQHDHLSRGDIAAVRYLYANRRNGSSSSENVNLDVERNSEYNPSESSSCWC